MIARRSLNLKLAMSVVVAFALSMAFSWIMHDRLADRDALKLIDQTFDMVKREIDDCVNPRLVLQCMAVRERLDDGYPTDADSLKRLAQECRVTEICVADAKGDIVASSVADYLARDGKPAFNYARAGGQAAEMMRLIDGLETEYCQPFRASSVTGAWRKYVGVWRPSGGFVEIGCDGPSLQGLSRSSIIDLFRNWRVAGSGGIVVTSKTGLILSDYQEPNREGTQWNEPDASFYWKRLDIDSFPTYVMIPREAAAVQRNVLVGSTALLNGAALVFVAFLVAFVIAAFVRKQVREQTAKDLEMATDIQLSALPSVFPPFPGEKRFSIWASMATAKEVGGDFYDFYFTGPDTIMFLIADVSGKGVPAALFMMRAKTLIKSAAQTGKPIAEVLTETNAALADGNVSNTFVTCWAGALNIRTGHVTYVNAGHNPPVVRRGGELEFLRGRHTLVLGAMPGFKYRAEELDLRPGDAIYLYTDGITEQPNRAQELFGEQRLLALLAQLKNGSQDEELRAVLAAVDAHAGGVERADDCTQLVLRYLGA